MRKYIALVLALVCVLGLVGCSANTVDKEKPVFEVDREKPIFETENICKITLFAIPYHADGIVVPSEYMDEITAWIGTFTIDKEAGDKLDPGTNKFSFRLEYSDGTIVESGANTTTIDGITYYMKQERPPECYNALFASDKPQIPEPDSWAQPVHFYLHGKGYFHRGEIAYELPEGYEFAGNVLDVGEVDADSRKDFEGNADGKIYMNPSVSDIAYFSWAEWNEKTDGPAPFLKLKRESAEPIIFVQDFSYAKDSEVYTEGKPGVKTSGFLNTSEMEINADNVVERAKNECTIHWREVSVRRDTAAGIWLVVFGNHYPGGGQSVYLDDHGKTVLIVYGE